MFLEEEVYGMLYWGFGSIMVTQFIFIIGLWINHKFEVRAVVYFLLYIFLFSLAGINLLLAINTFEYQSVMGSENASFNIAIAGISWALSVLFLLLGVFRLVKKRKEVL